MTGAEKTRWQSRDGQMVVEIRPFVGEGKTTVAIKIEGCFEHIDTYRSREYAKRIARRTVRDYDQPAVR